MAEKLASEEGRASYKLRRQTVEPVFGVIKAVLGFAGFSLRGLEKVEGEWNLAASRLQLQALAQAEPGGVRRLCCKPDVGVSQIRTTTVLSSCFCVGQTVL